MLFENTLAYARQQDGEDPLREFREEFYIPVVNGKPCIYLTGNSLGLLPRAAEKALKDELDDWKNLGVEGHFHGKNPWFHYHKFLIEPSAKLVGAKPGEVVIMNQLTSNLHFLFVSFYRPDKVRYKIIMEAGAFPSDMYLVESQVKFHGLNPADAIVEIAPKAGEHSLRKEDILETIERHGAETALVFFSGVQYYTGQVFDIAGITEKAHEIGAVAGFDLAHAAGNIELKLHDWNVDFASWCSYKYLNSGPGSVAGAFIHEKHGNNPDLPRFAGWWGHKEDVRFRMEKGFVPEKGAAGWQLSNAPVLSMSVHKASLDIFSRAGMDRISVKGRLLNAYLEFILTDCMGRNPELGLKIITPPYPERGCQISIHTEENGKKLFDHLSSHGVIADWRNPNVIRMAPVPLYNRFEDIFKLGQILEIFQ